MNSMYGWTIVLLIVVASLASYTLHIFPINFILSIIFCSVLDILAKKFYLKRSLSFPFSAFITGLIIGSIVPISASILVVFLACFAAIISKYLIRLKGRHVFNPAALGLIVSLLLFGLGDEWWAAIGFNFWGLTIPITIFLIFANYKADKLKVALPALIVTLVGYIFFGYVNISSLTLSGILSAVSVVPFFFIFIMLSEPKTSPYIAKEQIVFGIGVIILELIFEISKVNYSFFAALLIGNLLYAVYRSR